MPAGRRATILLCAVIALIGFGPAGVAAAGMSAVADRSQAINTPKWSAVFSSAPATASTNGATSAALAGDTFWWLSNNGTTALNTQWSVILTITTTGGAIAQLEQCAGSAADNWNETTDSCPTTTSVIAAANTPSPYTLPSTYPTGAAVRVRVHVLSGGAGQAATLNVSVRR